MCSSDELGELNEPLFSVTFVVLDLETTGGSPEMCAITEVGAVKLRGGDCLGKLDTLVNPGLPIPPAVTYLTGLTGAMVGPAPSIEAVLPSMLEFLVGTVVVGHNVRRRRVRSYFGGDGDDRRQVGSLLRELAGVDHIECTGQLEATVLERRLVNGLSPSYNRRSRRRPVRPKIATSDPGPLLNAWQGKMTSLAGAGPFDDAACLRHRIAALSDPLHQQRRLDALRSAGRLTIEVPGEGGVVVDGGRLVACWPEGGAPHPVGWGAGQGPLAADPIDAVREAPDHTTDEMACVAAWLDDRANRLKLVEGGTGLVWPLGA